MGGAVRLVGGAESLMGGAVRLVGGAERLMGGKSLLLVTSHLREEHY